MSAIGRGALFVERRCGAAGPRAHRADSRSGAHAAHVPPIRIYATRHRLQVPCVFDRVTEALKYSLSAFELSPQL